MEFSSPTSIYRYYADHFTYDNSDIKYWVYKPLKELEETFVCKCHDTSHFFYENLKKIGCLPKRIFMEMDSDDPKFNSELGNNHTLTTFKQNDEFYYMEGTWWSMYGIHGPFPNLNSLLRRVDHLYKLVWNSDPINPAPKGLRFRFYEFNDENEQTLVPNDENDSEQTFVTNEPRSVANEPIANDENDSEHSLLGCDINTFAERARGKEISIHHEDPLQVNIRGTTSGPVVIYCDETEDAYSNFKSINNVCDRYGISSVVCNSETKEAIKIFKGTKHWITFDSKKELKLDGLVVKTIKANLQSPTLNLIDDAYELKWFEDDEDRMQRHFPVAKLLVREAYKL